MPTFAHEEHVAIEHYELGPWSNLVLRIHTASHALGDIANRIDTRATIIAQAGLDSTDARAPLERARRLLFTADRNLEEAAASNLGTHEMPTPLRDTVTLLQDAKASLRESIAVLKDATADGTIEVTESIDVPAPEVQ